MAESQQWEYQVVSFGSFWTESKDEEMENTLNEMGEEGWEVVSVTTRYGTNVTKVFVKRPLSPENRRQRNWPR